ncbi:hypothetical protein DXT63_01550 [Thermoanaerobacteraceae bacterium SP2]|nr:hypothetical protein DXT63_01550 [Thermoanaerobacteraceae bacterium SP2]
MAIIIGHGMLQKYSRQIEIKQPENLKTVLHRLMLPESIYDYIIFVRQHEKLEDDSIINNEDEIHLFMITLGG